MSAAARDARATPGGFTLIEVAVSLTVFSVALMILFGFMGSGLAASTSSMTLSRLNQDGARAMEQIVAELRLAESDALAKVNAPLSSNQVAYRHPANVVNEAVVWGGVRMLSFEYDPADPDDGLDNNGNGLVDEGMVVLRTNVGEANERRRVIVTGVPEYLQGEVLDGVDNNANQLENECGFCLDYDAVSKSWSLHLTLMRRGTMGGWSWRTFETRLAPRN